jgi:hypothetical protein
MNWVSEMKWWEWLTIAAIGFFVLCSEGLIDRVFQ